MLQLSESAVQVSDQWEVLVVALGVALAVVCSWHRNRSLLWAILAGVFTWSYVIYFAATRKPDERKSPP